MFTIPMFKKILVTLLILLMAKVYIDYTDTKEAIEKTNMLQSVVKVNLTWTDPTHIYKDVTGHGSGVVIYHQGAVLYILTAAHVVNHEDELPNAIYSITQDGKDYLVQIVKIDTIKDLALLKVTTDFPAPVEGVCTQDIDYYSKVYSVGFPLNLGKSVSDGIISNPYSFLVLKDETIAEYIQHTAAIAPGDSGGPLFTKQGSTYCIAGINVKAASGYGVINLAVPLNQIKEFLQNYEKL